MKAEPFSLSPTLKWCAQSIALSMIVASCAGDPGSPLIGSWIRTDVPPGESYVMTLASDGTSTGVLTLPTIPACTGALTETNTWSVSSDALSFGATTCTGAIQCPPDGSGTNRAPVCDNPPVPPVTSHFALTNGADTLTLHFDDNSAAVFRRGH